MEINMDENYNPENLSAEPTPDEEQLSHSDKLTGLFTEPGKTFAKMAKSDPKTIDWLLPVCIMILLAIISNIVLMSNPVIKADAMDKQMKQMEKNFSEMVAKGQLTQEQADEQLENMRERFAGGFGAGLIVIQAVSTIVVLFIIFFIVSLVYFILSKSILKGNGTFASAMVANGLPYYINIIQIIIVTIVSLLASKLYAGTSVATFMDMEKSTFIGWLLGKVDPLTIWSVSVTGIGLAKMFRADNTMKYIIAVLVIWLGWGLIAFLLAKAVPFLSFLNM
jgi:hypothetical protein